MIIIFIHQIVPLLGGGKMSKRAIVSFATIGEGREDYIIGIERMVNSVLLNKIDSDIILFCPGAAKTEIFNYGNTAVTMINTYPITKAWGECPTHKEAPYGFKCYCS